MKTTRDTLTGKPFRWNAVVVYDCLNVPARITKTKTVQLHPSRVETKLLATLNPPRKDRPMTPPDACTKCSTRTAFTKDWTLWPWPDGAWLCSPCNDARHENEDYMDVEARVNAATPDAGIVAANRAFNRSRKVED